MSSGPAPVAFALAGEPEAWRAAGFAIGEDGATTVGAVALRVAAHHGLPPGILDWTLAPATGEGDVDGLPTRRLGEVPGVAATSHPNGALSVDHVVVATGDWWRTVGALQATGMVLRREREAGPSERPVKQGFFRHGECVVEVVGPAERESDAGPTRLWGLTLTVADLDAAAALLGERLGAIRDAVQPGRRIATLQREAGLGVPLALMST